MNIVELGLLSMILNLPLVLDFSDKVEILVHSKIGNPFGRKVGSGVPVRFLIFLYLYTNMVMWKTCYGNNKVACLYFIKCCILRLLKWAVSQQLAIIGQKDLELPNLFLQPRKMLAKRALPRRWHTFCKQNTLFMIREKSNIIMFDTFWTNLIPVCLSPVIIGLMPFS